MREQGQPRDLSMQPMQTPMQTAPKTPSPAPCAPPVIRSVTKTPNWEKLGFGLDDVAGVRCNSPGTEQGTSLGLAPTLEVEASNRQR
jgi:hypothetical protein